MPEGGGPPPSRLKRLLWFATLWIAGVLVVAAIAYAIRFVVGS